MFWSRFWRICLLTGIWATAAYVVSQSVLPLFKSRRSRVQSARERLDTSNTPNLATPTMASQLRKKTGLSLTMQRNGLFGVAVILLVGVAAQVLFSFHAPILSTFAPRISNANGATFLTQPSATAVARTRTFETGIVTPQWQQQKAYGREWQQSLKDIQSQTGSRWVELSLLFSQSSSTSTTVGTTQSTPLVSAFAAGIRAAHAQGLHVFVVPLMSVQESGGWAGSIHFSSTQDEQAWFESYWSVYEPYVRAAAHEGADQVAIATECEWLQLHAPSSLWNKLISRVHSIFTGTLTYDMNWYPLNQPIPGWFSNQNISMIGVSSYIPLTDVSTRIDPKAMFELWKNKIKSLLDSLSTRIGKPVLISEIGYRNSSDALYHSWEQKSTSPVDSAEQAAAYDAALANVIPDQHIAGIFFWGWQDVGMFTLKGQTMTNAVLHKWYMSV